jgi:hypothetical protein
MLDGTTRPSAEMRTVGREHPALPCGRAAIRLAGRDKPARGERCDGASLAWGAHRHLQRLLGTLPLWYGLATFSAGVPLH